MPLLYNGKPKSGTDVILVRCTCGRDKAHDKKDLAVIIEEDGITYKGNGGMTSWASEMSKVVCIREGCFGAWKSKAVYSKTLPRILWVDYVALKF